MQGTDGNLYGTTSSTFFRIPLHGTLTTLQSVGGSTGPLVQATDGNFYGATSANNVGTVFKITPTPNGTLTTLYSFCSQTNCTDGRLPSGLVQATDGNFYGITSEGGIIGSCGNFGCGTVFKLTPGGTLTTLYSFDLTDGSFPAATLLQATNGNLYGTTIGGGANSNGVATAYGTVFSLSVGLTPQQATQAIINAVNALFSQRVLNGGQDNSLVKELQQAIKLMNAGKNAGAIQNLNLFISEVNDLLSSGVLSASQAATLVSAAERLIAQLS